MSFDLVSYTMGMANGTGGAAGLDYGEPIVRNWDFSMPINTRGQTAYTGSGGTINGWRQVSGTKCEVVEGGIKVVTNGSDTNMYYQHKVSNESVAYAGKTMTLSLMANNKMVSSTFTIDTAQTRQGEAWLDGINLWFNRDSSSAYAFGFYNSGAGDETLIQAIKLEFGSVSTLCDVKNGVATLRKHQNIDDERVFLAALATYD